MDPVAERCLLAGQADRLNSDKGKLKWKQDGETSVESLPSPDYKVVKIFSSYTCKQGLFWQGVVAKIFNIVDNVNFSYVGHRVVHGGEIFKHATVMDKENIEKLSKIASLAPLHNPVQTEVIRICHDR